jgi:2-keto-4-pentenoate hydratase/2-oxohepta-3-ene-1,7-dioic acid hydratase in catechol pathway
MKIANFIERGRTRVGLVDGTDMLDVGSLLGREPVTVDNLLEDWPAGLDRIREASSRAQRFPHHRVSLAPPVLRPRKFLGIGLNYKSHVAEAERFGMTWPKHQIWFNKQATCIQNAHGPIYKPTLSDALDYEGELGIVIGRKCRHVSVSEAPAAIAGFTICNDVSIRDWQQRSPTATLGKSYDTHGPVGPWLVTPDEIDDPHDLQIKTWVNGELRQDSTTAEMIFNCYEQISELSRAFTLEPGDILSTGTPAGIGLALEPPRFLSVGDVVRIEISGIGVLENTVTPEPPPTPG